MEMTIPQCRAARALLGWTAADLADRAQIGAATVRRFESGQTVQSEMVVKMTTALVAAGLDFYAGGAVLKAERKSIRSALRITAGETSSASIGLLARSAIDDGIAALWQITKRAGLMGRLELVDYRSHWACHKPRELEDALKAVRDQAGEAEGERIDHAIEVLLAARLAHV